MNSNPSHADGGAQVHVFCGASDETVRFSYTYSAKQQREIENTRRKYLSAGENKLEQLHRLDRQAERRSAIISIVLGTAFTLLLGTGMALTMVYTGCFILGIAIGLTGIAGVMLTYPLCLRITRKEWAKIAPEILRLSDELLNGAR